MLERREAGVGLIEVVMAIVILGLTISALIAALITGVVSSTTHSRVTTQDAVLRSYAEAVKAAVRTSCPSNWTATYPGTLPMGFSVTPLTNQSCPAVNSVPTPTIALTVSYSGLVDKSMTIGVRQP